MKEKLFESVFINIEFCNKTLLVGCLYRSPFSDVQSNEIFVSTLKNCLNLVKCNQKCIITGDLNYDLANCENEHVSNFTEIMFENCYFPLINKPTRITDSSASVLDHMWTNIHDESIKSGISTSPISDHLPVFMYLNCDSQPKSPTPNLTRCFSSTNKFKSVLENIDINLILNETLPNFAFELLMESYSQAFNQGFPLKAFPPNDIKFNKRWYDDELHQLILNKDKLFKKCISKKSPTLKAKYNMALYIYFHTLQAKKSNYYVLQFEKYKFNLKAT